MALKEWRTRWRANSTLSSTHTLGFPPRRSFAFTSSRSCSKKSWSDCCGTCTERNSSCSTRFIFFCTAAEAEWMDRDSTRKRNRCSCAVTKRKSFSSSSRSSSWNSTRSSLPASANWCAVRSAISRNP